MSWWRTKLDESEADAARDAILSGRLSNGAVTAELEERLALALGVRHVTMTTSGSVALTIAFLATGIGPGDEVIMSDRTFIAAAHAAMILGATVRTVDTLPDKPLIDPHLIRGAIGDRTKAIVPCHINGRACDMTAINAIARESGLAVIEDAAQALFSCQGKSCLGTLGDIGCFSLGVTKFMTSGQGGIVATNDTKLHEAVQRMRYHGVTSPRSGTYEQFGFNFRYTDIQAAIMLKQLDRLERKLRAHRELYARYDAGLRDLAGIDLLEVNISGGELPLWIEVTCDNRDAVVDTLRHAGIETSVPMNSLSRSRHLEQAGRYDNAENFDRTVLTLPSGPDQAPEDIERTIDVLSRFAQDRGPKAADKRSG